MGKFISKHKNQLAKSLILVLAISLFTSVSNFSPLQPSPTPATAAQITVNADLFNTLGQYGPSPSIVWVSDTTGYAFYIDDTNDRPAYKKTTDSGASWGGEVDLAADNTWTDISIWYDRWTPGDTSGTYVYIIAQKDSTASSNPNDVYFKRLDTSGDTLSPSGTTWTKIYDADSDGVTGGTTGSPSIIKSTTDYLYALFFLGASSNQYYVYESTSTAGSSWSTTSLSVTAGNDFGQLMPLASGNIMVIIHDTSSGQDDLVSKVYNATTLLWDGVQTPIDSDFFDHATYRVTWGAAINKHTGDIYIVGNNRPATGGAGAGSIKSYWYDLSAGSWSTRTNVYTSIGTDGLGAMPVIDQQNGDIYAFYLRGTVGSAMHVYYKKSTDGAGTWGSEQGPVSSSTGNYTHLRGANVTPYRIFAAWYDYGNADMLGVNFSDTSALNIVETRMMLLWDGASVPNGWSSVSNDSTDIFYNKFPRGNSAYGPFGGADSHVHTANEGTQTDNGPDGAAAAGTTVAAATHTHDWVISFGSTTNLPDYRELQIIQYDSGIPTSLPQDIIALFDATVPTGWTQYSAQNSKFVRGGPDGETAGGDSSNHTHLVTLNAPSVSATTGAGTGAPVPDGTTAAHGHSSAIGISSTGNIVPLNVSAILGKKNAAGALPAALIAMFTASPGSDWSGVSGSSQAFNLRYIQGSSSYTSGGSASHGHTVSDITSGTTPSSAVTYTPGAARIALNTHTHTLPITIDNANNLPTYVDVVLAKSKIYTPQTRNWRWYADEEDETPDTPYEAENTAPPLLEMGKNTRLKLRINISNTGGAAENDSRKKLQYTTDSLNWIDVAATGTSSEWRYYNGGGDDNQTLASVKLTDSSSTDKGIHNESSSDSPSNSDHPADTVVEFEYCIEAYNPVVSTLYTFRLYDQVLATAISPESGKTNPHLLMYSQFSLTVTAPASVYFGEWELGSGGKHVYKFVGGEEITNRDNRGTTNNNSYGWTSSAEITTPLTTIGGAINPADMYWISYTTDITPLYAAPTTGMSGNSGEGMGSAVTVITVTGSGYQGLGGFTILPTVEIRSAPVVGDYTGGVLTFTTI